MASFDPAATVAADPLKVYVGNLNKTTADDALTKLFGAGSIANFERSASGIFSWITFKNAGAAAAALAKNGTQLDGYDIKVEPHRPRERRPAGDGARVGRPNRIFVGDLPAEVDASFVESLFSKFGSISKVRLNAPRGRGRRAYITFESVDSATSSLSVNGHLVGGHPVRVELESRFQGAGTRGGAGAGADETERAPRAPRRRAPRSEGSAPAARAPRTRARRVSAVQDTVEANPLRVFVGNLPRLVSNETLLEHFGSCGEITDSVAFRKGFGFVTFSDANGVAKAIALTGTLVGEREINVRLEEPRAARSVATGGAGEGEGEAVNKRRRVRTRKPRAEGAAPSDGAAAPRRRRTASDVDGSNGGRGEDFTAATVWIGNVPEGASKSDISTVAAAFGEVKRVRYLPRNRFAFVVYADEAAAHAAASAGSISLLGESAVVELKKPRVDLGARVYVGNLNADVTDAQVASAFGSAGEIVSIVIKSNDVKTFAHVTFSSADNAAATIGGNFIVAGAHAVVEASRPRGGYRRTAAQ